MAVRVSCLLNGIDYDSLVDLQGLEVLATFDNEAVQANISLEDVTFVNAAAVAIRQWIADGQTGGVGIFEGMPVSIRIYDNASTLAPLTVFDGYIDFTQAFEIISPVKVKCKLVKRKAMNDLETKLSALTYGLLQLPNTAKNWGGLEQSDFVTIPTVVVNPEIQDLLLIQLAALEINTYIQMNILVRNTIKDFPDYVTMAIEIINGLILCIASVLQAKAIIEQLLPTPSLNQGMTYYKALERVCAYLGYGFNTTIQEISNTPGDINYAYLPSRPDHTELTKGIPQSQDYGYRCSEMFELVLKMFDAKIAITKEITTRFNPRTGVNDTFIQDVVQVHNRYADYWNKSAKFKPTKSIQTFEQIKYNTDEYAANRIIQFQTDTTDGWTVTQFTGTNYEVITAPQTITNQFNLLNKGLDSVNINSALASINDPLGLVALVKLVVSTLNDVIKQVNKVKVPGQNNNAITPIKMPAITVNIKTTQPIWSINKTVAMIVTSQVFAPRFSVHGDWLKKISPLQKENVSAKHLYENYYFKRSFMPTNPLGQKRVYTGEKIPFGFSDFVNVVNNSYFAGGSNRNGFGKMVGIRWKFDKDYAIADWWENEIYTRNLQETFIEP